MNKIKMFDSIHKEYSKYISYCTFRFYEKTHYFLDIIYEKEDIEQMIYIQLWKYIGRYDKNKSSLKSYIIMIMTSTFSHCLYFSNAEKRQVKLACSLNKERINSEGEVYTLEDKLIDKSVDMDDKLNDYFYKRILNETYKKIYQLVKEGHTYREIGEQYHVTHQRIGQIVLSIGWRIRDYEHIENIKKN